jgi:hypothetical protein
VPVIPVTAGGVKQNDGSGQLRQKAKITRAKRDVGMA